MRLLIILFLGVPCLVAQLIADDRNVEKLLNASQEPFTKFVDAVVTEGLPKFSCPKENMADPALSQALDVLMRQIKAAKTLVRRDHREHDLETLESSCKLRKWLLSSPQYLTVVLGAELEFNISATTLHAILNGNVSTQEGRSIVDALRIPVPRMIAIEGLIKCMKDSKVVGDYQRLYAEGRAESLLRLSRQLEEPSSEWAVPPLSLLLRELLPSSYLEKVVQSSMAQFILGGLVDYLSKGGKLAGDYSQLTAEFRRHPLDVIGLEDPGSGMKIDKYVVVSLIEIAREGAHIKLRD